MGVSRTIITEGNGDRPNIGDKVTIEYTGWLKDTSRPDNKGKVFDSSVGRAAFTVQIGKGRVIRGWDEAVPEMRLGEKAVLDISSDYAYGETGFTGHIPPHADLIFEVELKNIIK